MTNAPQAFDLSKLKQAIIENTSPGNRFTKRGLSLKATAGKNPDLIRNLLNDKSKKPSFEAATGLIAAMGLDISEFSALPVSRGGAVYIKVVGPAEAGVWRKPSQWPDEQQYEVRALQSDFAELERFGLEVVGYSMDKLFAPKFILDCFKIPFSSDCAIRPNAGQLVIVQAIDGDKTETTCKRLGREPNGQWFLTLESTKAEHQVKIPIGAPKDNYWIDGDIKIVGIVSVAMQQFLTRG
jgi:hypothetical protein